MLPPRLGALLLLLAASPWAAQAHPHGPGDLIVGHEHPALGLEITIGDEAVVYDAVLSNGCFNTLIPRERGGLRLELEGETFQFLDPGQEAAERAAFEAFFTQRNPVTIDGVRVDPVFERMEFIKAYDPTGQYDHTTAPPDARIVLSYPTKGRPKRVELVWEVFPPYQTYNMFGEKVPYELSARLDAYAESRIVVFTREKPEVAWTAPDRPPEERVMPVHVTVRAARIPVPMVTAGAAVLALAGVATACAPRVRRRTRGGLLVAALGLIGVGFLARDVGVVRVKSPWSTVVEPPNDVEGAAILTSLLRNVYRSFDYKSESDVYDVLARSVDGDLLARIYREVFQSLVMQEQGGAVARVKSVEVLESDVLLGEVDRDGGEAAFEIRGRWRVEGVVYHWGHVHTRTNEYEAIYTIAQRDAHWKITESEVLQQTRVAD